MKTLKCQSVKKLFITSCFYWKSFEYFDKPSEKSSMVQLSNELFSHLSICKGLIGYIWPLKKAINVWVKLYTQK